MKSYVLLSLGLLVSGAVFADSYEFSNEKYHCVILKNGKVVKQQNCIADGYTYTSANSVSVGYDFRAIKGYGKISIDSKASDEGSFHELNKKPAIWQRRVAKTFQVINQQQYESGNFKDVYDCYTHKKNSKYEFCYLPK